MARRSCCCSSSSSSRPCWYSCPSCRCHVGCCRQWLPAHIFTPTHTLKRSLPHTTQSPSQAPTTLRGRATGATGQAGTATAAAMTAAAATAAALTPASGHLAAAMTAAGPGHLALVALAAGLAAAAGTLVLPDGSPSGGPGAGLLPAGGALCWGVLGLYQQYAVALLCCSLCAVYNLPTSTSAKQSTQPRGTPTYQAHTARRHPRHPAPPPPHTHTGSMRRLCAAHLLGAMRAGAATAAPLAAVPAPTGTRPLASTAPLATGTMAGGTSGGLLAGSRATAGPGGWRRR